MKKKLAMVTLLLATAITATSCNNGEVKPIKTDDGKSVIFSLKTDGETTDFYYTAEDLLADLSDSSAATSKLYSEVSRQVFTQYALNTLEEKKIESLKTEAADEVDEFKEDCETKAKEEGTDYDTYLESALEGKGVETTEELEALFFYEGLKEEVLEDYLEETGHYNYFLEKYLNAYTPFQVKHILVAANTADTNFKDGTMTADNARKLLKILNGFIDGETFETLATETDDTSSANNGGVMPFNEAQNYVQEFRFATYAQEIFANHTTLDDRFNVAAKLHIVDVDLENDSEQEIAKAKEEFANSSLYSVYKDGISTISLETIMKLEGDVTSAMAGAYNYYDGANRKENDLPTIAEQPYEMNVDKYNCEGKLNEMYYEEYQLERNKIFNSTLNTHQVKYIDLGSYAATMTANKAVINTADGEKTVLADEYGNPIFVALASTGIHFMSMVWNANNPVGESVTAPELSTAALDSLKEIIKAQAGDEAAANPTTKLYNQAYFTLFDDKTVDLADYQYTYIGRNGAYKSKSSLKANSDSLLSAISSYVSSLEYYVFDAIVYGENSPLVEGTNYYDLTFFDYNETDFASLEEYKANSELYNAVKDFVQDSLKATDESFATSVASAADTYGSKLAREQEVKDSAANWNK